MAERVGPYEVTELLASGGMAEVFLGKKPGPGGFEKQLVIKRITKKLIGDREIEAMFLDEARVQALLDHPNIVQIYDFGEEKGSYYIAMELVRGATLRWVIDNAAAVRRPIPIHHAVRITSDILAGLHYAHERAEDDGAPLKLIHRDISPVNVLITRSGIAKLCDFGVAKSELQRALTRAGIVKGKFRYMSPEQVNAEPLDHRADLFAVGAVLWEMIVGRRLFDQANEDGVVAAIRSGSYPSVATYRTGVPQTLDRALRRALHPQRNHRWKTAREFQLACEEILRQLPVSSSSVLVGEYVSNELDGRNASGGFPVRRKGPFIPEGDSLLASGFEALDPPVPSAPTRINALPPVELDDEGFLPPRPSFVGKVAGGALVASALIFGGIGKAIEALASVLSSNRTSRRSKRGADSEVRISRTQMRD